MTRRCHLTHRFDRELTGARFLSTGISADSRVSRVLRAGTSVANTSWLDAGTCRPEGNDANSSWTHRRGGHSAHRWLGTGTVCREGPGASVERFTGRGRCPPRPDRESETD